MDENIDLLSKDGKPTGKTALKSVVHAKGYYHNTAHIWFYTKEGKILLSQRSAKKEIYPLLWDVSVAGHIDAGETIKQGALREIREEIGLSVLERNLREIGVFKSFKSYNHGILDNEFHHTFITELQTPISKLTPQETEVESLKLISLSDFDKLINTIGENGNHFVPSNKAYYQLVLKSIQTSLSF